MHKIIIPRRALGGRQANSLLVGGTEAVPRYHLANLALTRGFSSLLNHNHKPKNKPADKPELE